MLRLACIALAAAAIGLAVPGVAHAGVFTSNGATLTYLSNTGDTDKIAGFETSTSIRFTRFGGAAIGQDAGCSVVAGDSDTVDCPKAGLQRVVLLLGDGDDVATVSGVLTVPVTFFGGPGNDALFGGKGTDTFFGEGDNDNVVARDGVAEQVDCGAGFDTAITDDPDNRISCEEIEGDADGDGVRRPADCDDTRPTIRPGVLDVPDNGIDEDCSGVDSINLDRDGDGIPRPQDCDDTNGAIKPGLREVIGNATDENCDTLIAPFPPLSGSVSSTWTRVGRRTRNLTLVAKGFPRGTRITVRCVGSRRCSRGTKVRRVRNARRAVNLHATLGSRALESGARVEVGITRAARVGRLLTYRFNTPGTPDVSFRCDPPGKPAGLC